MHEITGMAKWKSESLDEYAQEEAAEQANDAWLQLQRENPERHKEQIRKLGVLMHELPNTSAIFEDSGIQPPETKEVRINNTNCGSSGISSSSSSVVVSSFRNRSRTKFEDNGIEGYKASRGKKCKGYKDGDGHADEQEDEQAGQLQSLQAQISSLSEQLAALTQSNSAQNTIIQKLYVPPQVSSKSAASVEGFERIEKWQEDTAAASDRCRSHLPHRNAELRNHDEDDAVPITPDQMEDANLPHIRREDKIYYRLGLDDIDRMSVTVAKNSLKDILLQLDLKWDYFWENLTTLQTAQSERKLLIKLAKIMHEKVYDGCEMKNPHLDEECLRELLQRCKRLSIKNC